MIEVFYSPDDGGYIARLSDRPGISAFGETFADAIHEILLVLRLCRRAPALI